MAGQWYDHLALNVRGNDRAAAEPRALEPRKRVSPREQRAEAGRVAEQLVEGHRDEVGPPDAEVQPAGRQECGGIDYHVPPALLREGDPLERMLDAGEVGLRRVGEEVVPVRARVVEVALEQPVGNAEIGSLERNVRGRRTLCTGELADAVDRVVVVERRQETAVLAELEGLTDQSQRTRRVGSEDAGVLTLLGIEVAQDGSPRLFHQ